MIAEEQQVVPHRDRIRDELNQVAVAAPPGTLQDLVVEYVFDSVIDERISILSYLTENFGEDPTGRLQLLVDGIANGAHIR